MAAIKIYFPQKIAELSCNKMKILKNEIIDLEATQNYFNESSIDDIWKPVIKNSIDFCHAEILKSAEKLQTESLIPKNHCNVSFGYFLDCIYIHSFSVRINDVDFIFIENSIPVLPKNWLAWLARLLRCEKFCWEMSHWCGVHRKIRSF